jgi:DNA-binding NarL/FixJ family response regulator
MSEGTVKRHISEILAKTGYDNVLRLAVHAVSNGLIVPRMNNAANDQKNE